VQHEGRRGNVPRAPLNWGILSHDPANGHSDARRLLGYRRASRFGWRVPRSPRTWRRANVGGRYPPSPRRARSFRAAPLPGTPPRPGEAAMECLPANVSPGQLRWDPQNGGIRDGHDQRPPARGELPAGVLDVAPPLGPARSSTEAQGWRPARKGASTATLASTPPGGAPNLKRTGMQLGRRWRVDLMGDGPTTRRCSTRRGPNRRARHPPEP
jgi:hypothetical protein